MEGDLPEVHQSLIGYAVLRANYNASAPSFLDNFRGFVLDGIAALERGQVANSGSIAEVIADRFGMRIPTLVVKRLAKRAVIAGAIAGNERDGYRLTDKGAKEAPRVSEQLAIFSREQAELVTKFRKFLMHRSPVHTTDSDGKLAEQLSNYFQVHSVELLAQALRGENNRTAHTEPGYDYLISTFVAELSSSDQVAFGYVENAAKGAILASVVTLDTSSLQQSLTGLTVLLDTPVMIDLMGWHGEAAEVATNQLIAIIHALGAKVAAFDHSLRELDGVLANAESSLRPGKRARKIIPRIDSYFIAGGYSPADILTLRNKLEAGLEDHGVRIMEKPDGYMRYGLDEEALGTLLDKAIGYKSIGTRNYDIDSLSAVHRLRKGASSSQLERLTAVFVTSNVDLARASQEFSKQERGWPLAMTDFALAAMLWVRRPDAADSLPRQQLVATAYAGMQPDQHLWGAYLDEVDRLVASGTVSDDDAVIFLSGPEPKRALMEVTLGEENDLNAESLQEVLARVREEYQRPGRELAAKAEEEVRSATDAVDSITQDWLQTSAETEQLKKNLELQETHRKSLEADIAARQLAEENRSAAMEKAAARSAHRWVLSVLLSGAGLLITLGALAYFFPGVFPSPIAFLRVPSIIAGAAVASLSIVRAFIPGTVSDWTRPIERRLAEKIFIRRLRSFGEN